MPRINKGKIFLLANLFFIGGIFIGHRFLEKTGVFWLFFFLIIAGLWFLIKGKTKKILIPAGFIFLAFALGVFRIGYEKTGCPTGYICNLNLTKVSGYGTLNKCSLKDKTRVKCQLADLKIKDQATDLKVYEGKITVTLPAEEIKGFQSGDKVSFSGLVEEPENFNDFNYRGYLLKDGIYAILKKPQVHLLVQGKVASKDLTIARKFQRFVLGTRENVEKRFAKLWQGKTLGLMRALLIGDKSYFSDQLKDNFQAIGISHLVAISGMHITIITNLLLSFFFFLGFSRQSVFGGIVIALILFVVFIGTPISAVRALLMGSLGFWAKLLGRKIQVNNLLFFTASMILLHNPLLLFYDVGFQLSFCAVWGIFNLLPTLENFSASIPKLVGIKQAINMSIAAQLTTLPVALYHFHYFSLISILANALVFWVVFPIIFLGIIALSLSFINFSLASLFALVAKLGVLYLIGVAEALGKFQWAGIEVEKIQWGWLGLLVLTVGAFFFQSKRLENKKLSISQ
ncbi:MAG: ComEC/Rec2 family competence protein [Patescibacteria group bacterium]|nr:ComEC/Rec2 family competence protein [Patescibacteria group bacterium]